MNVPLSWLKQYVDIPEELTAQDIADKMIMTGSEVEDFEETGAKITNVVTGKITKIEKHENSDHLQICQLDIGDGKDLQIVTGAQNVFVGAVVPVALDGANLPNGMQIKNGQLRGVASNGMLCSGEELCVNSELFPESAVYGIWILKEGTPLGMDIKEIINDSDTVFDFKTYANRPDCMSIIGVAREAAATFGTSVHLPEIKVEEKGDGKAEDYVSVSVEDYNLCKRYCGRIVKNIRIAPSPEWMQRALIGAGVRPINNVVDITNYVMLEQGQPMHAFDYSCIRGNKIIVRKSEADDVFTTLDSKEHVLSMQPLCICDNEGIIGLAGIMGGLNSEITENTKTVMLESAIFDGTSIRVSSRALGMRTEASARYEKGIAFDSAMNAIERAAQLFEILDAGDVVPGIIDEYDEKPEAKTFDCDPDRIRSILGMDIPTERMVEILDSVFFSPVLKDNGMINVTVPYWRLDVAGAADVAEEVLRIYGFDEIPSTLMTGEVKGGGRSHKQQVILDAKIALADMGLYEITTFSFVTPRYLDMMSIPEGSKLRNTMRILNPLGEDMSVMRTMLMPSVLNCAKVNQNNGAENINLFEINRVFISEKDGESELQPSELTHLSMVMVNRSFFEMKGVIEELLAELLVDNVTFTAGGADYYHPGRRAVIKSGDVVIGEMGELHPNNADNFDLNGRVMACELDMDAIIALSVDDRRYVPIARTPAVTRDMAVVVDEETPVGNLLDAIRRSGKGLLESVSIFDIYRGEHVEEGKKSVAFSLVYRDSEKTLKDDDVKKAFDRAVRSLGAQFGAKLRD